MAGDWHWRPGGAYHQAIDSDSVLPQPPAVPAATHEELRRAAEIGAAHVAWWQQEQERVAERLGRVRDPVERFLSAVMSKAYGATSVALRSYVERQPAVADLGSWFAQNATVAPTPCWGQRARRAPHKASST